jgi:hypothetical protein
VTLASQSVVHLVGGVYTLASGGVVGGAGGQIVMSAGVQTFYLSGSVLAGSVVVNAGTLVVSNAGLLGGVPSFGPGAVLLAQAGGVVRLTSSPVLVIVIYEFVQAGAATTVSGAGANMTVLTMTSGVVTIEVDVVLYVGVTTLSGGSLAGAGGLVAWGAFTWTGGSLLSGSTARFLGALALSSGGTLVCQTPAVFVEALTTVAAGTTLSLVATVWTVSPTATLALNGASVSLSGDTQSQLVLYGVVHKTLGGVSQIDVVVV